MHCSIRNQYTSLLCQLQRKKYQHTSPPPKQHNPSTNINTVRIRNSLIHVFSFPLLQVPFYRRLITFFDGRRRITGVGGVGGVEGCSPFVLLTCLRQTVIYLPLVVCKTMNTNILRARTMGDISLLNLLLVLLYLAQSRACWVPCKFPGMLVVPERAGRAG